LVLRRSLAPFPARLAVIGGQCRKVGKSSLVVDLIRAFPNWHWTAVKITPYAESGCPVNGANCGCAAGEHTFAIREEKQRDGKADTMRYLGAGALRAIWVQTKEGQLSAALRALAAALAPAESVIIESDAIVRHWQPDLFIMVLDPRKVDFKPSARQALPLVDAFVLRSPFGGREGARQREVTRNGKRKFIHPLGYDLPASMQTFIRQHFRAHRHLRRGQTGSLFS
jgi:hypothetical protein